jgi:glycosyltransferase involved in cell wall biosynthesis
VKEIPGLKFIIVGTGTEVVKLKSLVRTLQLDNSITFLDWVKHDEMYRLIQSSSICLIPHLKSEHTDTTIPNKIFDYMALEKPVLASNLKPLIRIIDECKCGMIFTSGSADDLGKKIKNILLSPDFMKYGKNGRKAVLERFNWGMDAKRLHGVIDNLIGE